MRLDSYIEQRRLGYEKIFDLFVRMVFDFGIFKNRVYFSENHKFGRY